MKQLDWRANNRGALAVEFALLSPLLLFIFIAAMDLATAVRASMQLGAAARAGVEYAAIKGYDSAGITTAVNNATSLNISVSPTTYCGCASSAGFTKQSCTDACPGGGAAGTYASVTVKTNYTPMFPFPWNKLLLSNYLRMSNTTVVRTN